MEQFWASNGKYLTLIVHELLKITMENQVTFPSLLTIKLEEMDESYVETSALRGKKKKEMAKWVQ